MEIPVHRPCFPGEVLESAREKGYLWLAYEYKDQTSYGKWIEQRELINPNRLLNIYGVK